MGRARRRKRTEIRRANVQRILEAAEVVFSRRGLPGATIEEIAAEARLPKANLLYYFPSKRHLYRAVIDNIVQLWLSTLGEISPDSEPREALLHYLRLKVRLSKERPHASRVFAAELISGAPVIGRFLRTDLRRWVDRQASVFRQWSRQGRMGRIDPRHLFFLIWAMTQTYADFQVQVEAVLGKRALGDADYATAEHTIAALVLKGCDLHSPPARRGQS
jgi:TetR/AcrR family transcriptional regulator